MNRNFQLDVSLASLLRMIAMFAIVLAAQAQAQATPPALPKLTLGIGFESDPIHAQSLDKLVFVTARSNVAVFQPVAWRRVGSTPSALIEATRKGELDMAIVPYAAVAAIEPTFEIFTTPFLFSDSDHLERVQLGSLGYKILGNLATKQLTGVGWWPGPFLEIAGDNPVLAPEDLRHNVLVYQSQANITASKEIARRIGIDTKSVGTEKNPTLGKSEILEATPAQINTVTTKRLFVTLTHHLNDGYVIIANPAAWKRLDRQKQNELDSIIRSSWHYTATRFQEQQDALFSNGEHAATVSILEQNDLALWQARMTTPEQEAAMDGIREKARNYPILIPVSGMAPPERISWNTWLEDSQDKDIEHLTVGNVGQINLDLARLPYRRIWSTSPDKRIARELAASESIRLLVQPILLGPLLTPAPGQHMSPFSMTISLKNATVTENDVSTLNALADGKVTTKAVSAMLALGNIAHWPVLAKGAGCADVAFAVWDEARLTPLDHIVVSFPVAQAGAEPEKCYGKYNSEEMRAGLETLLTVPQGESIAVDLALHVFEFNEASFPRSVAVLVDARRMREAAQKAGKDDSGVYAWELNSALSEYSSRSEQLPMLIARAHKRLQDNNPYPYGDVVMEMAGVLFGGKSSTDIETGTKAAQAFKDVIAQSSSPKVIMRLIDEMARPIYLPLGLLAAKAQTPFASKRFAVYQTLPEFQSEPVECIEDWHVGRSPTVTTLAKPSNMLKLAQSQPTPPHVYVMSTHQALYEYLNPPTGAGAKKPEGLIMLAHHDQGNLSFNDNESNPSRIRSEYIKRKFHAGSFALLAACSTSGTGAGTSAIVERLTQQGFSSIVLSPFAVDIEFGTQLALAFEKQVSAQLAHPTGASTGELYEQSIMEINKAYNNSPAVRDMALEFQLVGNPNLRICAPR